MVQVISREIIKPSSPTPLHLQKMKRSYLDQLIQHMFVPLIFFYQAADHDHDDLHTSQHLKQSLSLALTSFYPIAGRMQDNFIVDCNDAGVEFVDASVDAQLDDAMHEPDLMKQYLPMDPSTTDNTGSDGPLFRVQINSFKCGGIAIGVCFSHLIADCASIVAFIGAWAATNCRSDHQIPPTPFSFDELANYFPGREFPPGPALATMPGGKLRMKRFLFDKVKLAALRRMAASSTDDNVTNPTRVELVSAFIWKNFMDKQPSNKTFLASHGVNLRPRKCALENVFGNCLMLSFAHGTSGQDFHQLISKLRNSIWNIDDDYITKSQGNGDKLLSDLFKNISPIFSGEMDMLAFSSWCRFPVYEVDFGWGKPVWVCTADFPMMFSSIVFVNTRCGEGIEAWVRMNQEKLDILEAEFKLISSS